MLRGLLDANYERVLIVHLDRTESTRYLKIIDSGVFCSIDADPLVRFSNLLETIIYSKAIICENEADCLFYRNLCRAINPLENDNEIFWLSAHGKQNIQKFVSILRKLGQGVISIPDLDIINNRKNLRSLFESHGGEWEDILEEYNTLSRLMKERKPTVSAKDISMKITSILHDMPTDAQEIFPDKTEREIRNAMREVSPWREIKENGISAFGRGENKVAAQNLLDKMKNHGEKENQCISASEPETFLTNFLGQFSEISLRHFRVNQILQNSKLK